MSDEFNKKCKLNYNPFEPNPSVYSDKKASTWAGYADEKRKLTKQLKSSRSDMQSLKRLFVIHGDFGVGKTHAILWALNKVLVREKDDFNAVAYFFKSVKNSVGKFKFADIFLKDIVDDSSFLSDLISFQNFIKNMVSEYSKSIGDMSKNREESIKEIFGSPSLSNLAIKIDAAKNEQEIKKIVTNEKDYVKFLASVTNLFTFPISIDGEEQRFKKVVYIFFDELDDLMGASAAEARQVNDDIRHLYDHGSPNMCICLSISANITELSSYFMEYVLSRINRYIPLELMDSDQAKEFVKDAIIEARSDNTKVDDFFPFSEECIETLLNIETNLKPRSIFAVLNEILNEIRVEEFEPSKDSIITTDLLEDLDLLDDIGSQI